MAQRPPRSRPNVSEMDPMPTEQVAVHDRTNDLVADLHLTADKLVRDHAVTGDVKIISRAAKELRYAFKVFTPYRTNRKVSIFGSARMKPDHPSFVQAVECGRLFGKQGWYIVTGAGGGIMEAAHIGCGREKAMGLNIMLPFEQDANPVINDDPKLVNFKYFFTRKLLFVKEVHAIVIFPGGFGTHDECFETITLIQTGKRDLMPIVLVDQPGGDYWKDWVTYVRKHLLDTSLISPEDMSLFTVVSDPQDAVDEVLRFYTVYNSMRYIREKLYLRLHVEPTPGLLALLNSEFQDILVTGIIETVPPHPMEANDAHLADLHRISLHFNRRSFGRLRQMINFINAELMDQDAP
ncbi:TIGR00730 family Rossman fold protein [Planctomyces sp. SH-PL14]|uniref:LOG family protein n=1 Tax=Planctomyces sp. SH-PL14 TaxID=1632864 RepID=UPI00078B9CC7|nr:TIGR00730 family Rossman fold protein [Planctomyces sp. SH-PL14]AMV17098.1 putative lysine decarboxylase [Planctomyces sp. SH-PL14]